MGEGGLIPFQHAELHIVAHVGHASHDLDPRGRAQRLGVAVLKANACLRQFVEMRCLVGSATVGIDAFVTHVICHDEDDVGFVRACAPFGRPLFLWCRSSSRMVNAE